MVFYWLNTVLKMTNVVNLNEREPIFIKKDDDKFGSLYKNWLQSKRKSRDWLTNRWSYLKGINRFHRSTKGKKFHRQLGRFLSTRFFEDTSQRYDTIEALIALSSAKTHLLLELLYDFDGMDRIDYEFFCEYAHEQLSNIEEKISKHKELNEEELGLLKKMTLGESL
jgi:hypothetical protein